MTGAALHTNEILQRCMKYLVLNKIVIAFTVINSVLISTWISVRNMRICNVLLNFFVSVYINIKKRLLLRCTHHLISDLINNMGHMRISGI